MYASIRASDRLWTGADQRASHSKAASFTASQNTRVEHVATHVPDTEPESACHRSCAPTDRHGPPKPRWPITSDLRQEPGALAAGERGNLPPYRDHWGFVTRCRIHTRGEIIQFSPQQRLYLRPLPQGHGSLRPTFFPVGLLARLAGCLRAFQKSCMPLMA